MKCDCGLECQRDSEYSQWICPNCGLLPEEDIETDEVPGYVR